MAHVEGEKKLPELPIKGTTLAELAKELKLAKAKKKKLEEQSKQQGNLINRLAIGPLAKMMEDRDEDFVNIPGVGALEYGIEVYPSIKKDDQETWFEWLRKNKHGGLIVEYIHYKTLQAFVVEQLGNGVKLPDYVNAAKIPTVTIGKERKTTKKKLKK